MRGGRQRSHAKGVVHFLYGQRKDLVPSLVGFHVLDRRCRERDFPHCSYVPSLFPGTSCDHVDWGRTGTAVVSEYRVSFVGPPRSLPGDKSVTGTIFECVVRVTPDVCSGHRCVCPGETRGSRTFKRIGLGGNPLLSQKSVLIKFLCSESVLGFRVRVSKIDPIDLFLQGTSLDART